MRVATALVTAAASIGLPLLGDGQAAAFSVTSSKEAVSVEFTSAEARTITANNLGPVLGGLPLNFTPQAKAALGEAISRAAAAAAHTPGATVTIIVDQPVLTPPGVSVLVTPAP